METILKTRGLTKRYGKTVAANNVNISINKGDIYGLVGKNGAGKTTVMKLLLGMAFPDAGNMEILGTNDLDAARRRIGSLIEAPGLYRKCSAYENMKRFSILYGGTDRDIKEILTLVGLENAGHKKAGEFSLGMRQRLGIGLALLGNPDILVLDEPINGLDPEGIKEIRDTIIRLNQEKGMTFMISSHLLDELSKIVTRYGIIRDGVLVEEFTADELNQRCADGLRIKTPDLQRMADYLTDAIPCCAIEIEQEHIVMRGSDLSSAQINRRLVMAGFDVDELTVQLGSLEGYFIERMG